MSNKICEGCDLYKKGHCTKWRENGECKPSTRNWLTRDQYEGDMSFISVDRMCRNSSIFGNEFIGLTQTDIERIQSGEIIHIPGEYGTFIGFIEFY